MSETKNQVHERYQQKVKERLPKSKTLSECWKAFVVGGIICCIGQFIFDLFNMYLDLPEKELKTLVSISMIFLGTFLTGLGVYDKIGKFAGAGSIVPITGFANSVAAPAMEHKPEGFVTGLGAKLFTIAGPVLVYGISASVAVGLLTLLFG